MKIVQVITRGDTFYGAQAHVLDLCRLLADDGQEVVAVVGNEGKMTRRLTKQGTPFQVVPRLQRSIHPLRDFRCIQDLANTFRRVSPDLIATHSSKAGVVARLAGQRLGIPVVFTAHGWSFEEGVPYLQRKLFLTVERHVARHTNYFISVAELGRKLAIENRVAPAERIVTIHYGVHDIGGQCVRRRRNEPFTMTMVAGFRKQKDHPTFIRALGELKDRNWVVHLLGDDDGDGHSIKIARDLVERFGLSQRVHFHGAVNNVSDFLCQSHLKVLTTNWEGLPISVIEALSYGLPVVASDVSGVREEVIDEHNGLLTPRGDVQAVTVALARLIDDRKILDSMGRNSRELFLQKFTQAAMYQKTKHVYKKVIAEAA